ncbi:MAG: TlpA disulfide reductase family protein [Aureliella sp.]
MVCSNEQSKRSSTLLVTLDSSFLRMPLPDWRSAVLPFLFARFTRLWSVVLLATSVSPALGQDAGLGTHEVLLETPGGDLAFTIALSTEGGDVRAEVVNGPERIPVTVRKDKSSFALDFPHFASEIVFEMDVGKLMRRTQRDELISGMWTKRRGPDQDAKVPCQLRKVVTRRWESPEPFLGRWSVSFADSDDLAVGVFERFRGKEVLGTFLTTTGDYRYLHGGVLNGRLRLTCFDGAHAFLFHSGIAADGVLSGEFYSGNWYRDTWTATRDENARLPDAFQQTSLAGSENLAGLEFPDAEGRPHELSELAKQGTVTLVEVFGTWCPNCHDEAAYLKELRGKYGGKGLQVVGLAFELSGDFEKDALQVQRYRDRFGIDYPILIAGTSDKALASKQFPIVDRIRSYPTTLFVDRNGKIRAVYTGFSGPATGKAHVRLRGAFEALIDKLMQE